MKGSSLQRKLLCGVVRPAETPGLLRRRRTAQCKHVREVQRVRDDEKRDQWVTRLSELTGENIATVFDAWNVPISQTAREACAKYPRPKDNKLFAGLD